MRYLRLVIVLVAMIGALQVSSGHAQFLSPCFPDEALLRDTLYFADRTVALPGCYPIADFAALVRMADARRDSRPDAGPVCRPAYPGDDALANVLACSLPNGIVLTVPGAAEEGVDLSSTISSVLLERVGAVIYSGPANAPPAR
jgi:hypothetical protein